MERDLERLSQEVFDVLVVGGGIHGACIARDAAVRGLKVALVEREDFGAATSHNSLKLIHGGFRYLQHLDFPRVRQSLQERHYWLWAAPHLVRPLKFLMPLYGHTTRGPAALWAATQLYQLLGMDRNRDLPPGQRIPAGGVVSRAECQRLIPGVDSAGLSGGAYWYDGQMLDADRLLLACLHDACAAGAVVANHCEATGFLGDETRVAGVKARDRLTDDPLEIRARLTVNACGPWVDGLLARGLQRRRQGFTGLSKCMNLVIPQLNPGFGFAVRSHRASDAVVGKSRRLFFFTPWHDRTVVGTSHLPYTGAPDDCRFTEQDVAEFLAELDAAYPSAGLRLEDVYYCYGGMTPAEEDAQGKEVRRSRSSEIVDHRHSHGIQGLISAVGVKWTTARWVAEQAVDRAFEHLDQTRVACRLRQRPLPGGRDTPDTTVLAEQARRELGNEVTFSRLRGTFGSEYSRVLADGGWQAGEADGAAALLRARCRYAIRMEQARRLGDLVFRRLDLSHRGHLDAATLRDCAETMGAELGWSAARVASELAAVQRERLWRPAPGPVSAGEDGALSPVTP